jgi:hypothetical protein
MRNKIIAVASLLSLVVLISGCSAEDPEPASVPTDPDLVSAVDAGPEISSSDVAEYIQRFPYQDTYNYAVRYTNSDPAKLNTWILGTEPILVKAGDDAVVRMNNDTYYKMAFLHLQDGPVLIKSSTPASDRFNSLQLMDDRNANYRNVIFPAGDYTFYFGEKPEHIVGEAIEVPSVLSVVIVRVEVRDKNDPDDVEAAKDLFTGITISGDSPTEFPQLDLLGEFDSDVVAEATRQLEETFANNPFTDGIVGPGQEPGREVPYINHSAVTKGGWGGPDPAHSAYDTIFFDENGEDMVGNLGSYTLTTTEPPVDAFWSITVYDTDRGGFLHPNDDDRYHINNTTAIHNDDGIATFLFKQRCEDADQNCLEVPAGRFDLTARYYQPHEEIISGEWVLPRAHVNSE